MNTQKLITAMAIGLGGGIWLSSAWAAGSVDTAKGEVSVLTREGQPRGVRKGDRVVEGETIVTGTDGELLLTTDDSGVLAVRPRTRLLIENYKVQGNEKDSVVIQLLRGSLRSITGWISKTSPKNYRIVTSTATIGIRGTDHETAVEEGENAGTWNQVTEGGTTTSNSAGTVEQQADSSTATVRATSQNQNPAPAPPPRNLFFPRASDQQVLSLKLNAQQNQVRRLQLRQRQVALSGGVTNQGNPRVSSQCAPGAPAGQALDALLRAYERGDVAYVQQRLDPSVIGYAQMLSDMLQASFSQRQTRIQVIDRQMQCGPDVSIVEFSWERYSINSATGTPQVQRGRSSVLISGLGAGVGGQWRLNGLVGDNPLRNLAPSPAPALSTTTPAPSPLTATPATPALPASTPVSSTPPPAPTPAPAPIPVPSPPPPPAIPIGTDGSITAPASLSYANAPQSCTTPSILATAALTAPVSGSWSATSTACSASQVSFTCSVTVPGSGVFVSSPQTIANPTCALTGLGAGSGVVNYSANLGSQTINALSNTSATVNIPVSLAATVTVSAGAQPGYTMNMNANGLICSALVSLPAVTPVCTPVASNLAANIEVRDSDLTAPSVNVQVSASNGDSENLTLLQVSPGVYRLSALPINRGASAVSPGNGRIDLVGANPGAVTLTLRYSDALTSTGGSAVRIATILLVF